MRAILTYHSVDPSGSVISIDPEAFRTHVEWLAEDRVQVVSVPDLLSSPKDAHRVALTFDDGFANFGSVAWPLLRERGLPATLFVVTDHVGGTNRWDGVPDPALPELELLSWDELGRLQEEGVHIGSHSRRHPSLPGLPAARLEDELAASRELLARRLGKAPTGFAYPYGDFDDTVLARAAGLYDWACTTELAPLGDDVVPHRLPRIDSFYLRQPNGLAGWGEGSFRTWILARRLARDARGWLRRRVAG